MLDLDYSIHYADLVGTTDWKIELPEDQKDFFLQSGIVSTVNPEHRASQRRIVRVRGLMILETRLPSIPRERQWLGVYTKDFSKDSCGLVSPMQWFPEEIVRLILPTFWLLLKVERCRRWNHHCYDVGLALLQRHDPNPNAFV